MGHFATDNENNQCSKEYLLIEVFLSMTPPGLHEKKVERIIQTIKRRLRATVRDVLPGVLELEAHVMIIRLSNIIPTHTVNMNN